MNCISIAANEPATGTDAEIHARTETTGIALAPKFPFAHAPDADECRDRNHSEPQCCQVL